MVSLADWRRILLNIRKESASYRRISILVDLPRWLETPRNGTDPWINPLCSTCVTVAGAIPNRNILAMPKLKLLGKHNMEKHHITIVDDVIGMLSFREPKRSEILMGRGKQTSSGSDALLRHRTVLLFHFHHPGSGLSAECYIHHELVLS